MKQHLEITDLAKELQRQKEAKRDFLADTSLVSVESEGDRLALSFPTNGQYETFTVNDNAGGQIAARLNIPKAYYDRLSVNMPDILADHLQARLHRDPEKRMIRTLDGKARAFVSERYRPLDNYDLADKVFPILARAGVQVESSAITETRMYIKAVSPRVQMEVQKGDIVQAGVVISNSEVGAGALRVESLIYRLVCLNGMITGVSLRKSHLGGRQGIEDAVFEVLTDQTKQLSDAAFWSQVGDVTQAALDEAHFAGEVAKLRAATEHRIEGDIQKAVETTAKQVGLQEGETSDVLRHLIEGGDLSKYGVANAITRTSQDVEDYDRATTLERMGSKVIELPKTDWQAIAQAHA